MSTTLFRLGLWIVLIVVVLYVIHETYTSSPVSEYVSVGLLGNAVIVGAVLLVAGVVMRVLEKGSKAVRKNRCAVCGVPVAHGAIYCRAHLRRVLHEEEDRTHGTRVRR